jgi:hypothetical protein
MSSVHGNLDCTALALHTVLRVSVYPRILSLSTAMERQSLPCNNPVATQINRLSPEVEGHTQNPDSVFSEMSSFQNKIEACRETGKLTQMLETTKLLVRVTRL